MSFKRDGRMPLDFKQGVPGEIFYFTDKDRKRKKEIKNVISYPCIFIMCVLREK